MRIAIIGYGRVGTALARAFLRAGHRVVLAENPVHPGAARAAIEQDAALAEASSADPVPAVDRADLVVLAVPFGAVADALRPLADHLDGTILVDATNPVGPGLTHGLASRGSGAEQVAALAPRARVVKAFSVYGFENLEQPARHPAGIRPVMPLAGDDPTARETVAGLLGELGWEPLVVGPLAAAVDLEHLTLLWIRLVRQLGHDPRLVWAALR